MRSRTGLPARNRRILAAERSTMRRVLPLLAPARCNVTRTCGRSAKGLRPDASSTSPYARGVDHDRHRIGETIPRYLLLQSRNQFQKRPFSERPRVLNRAYRPAFGLLLQNPFQNQRRRTYPLGRVSRPGSRLVPGPLRSRPGDAGNRGRDADGVSGSTSRFPKTNKRLYGG